MREIIKTEAMSDQKQRISLDVGSREKSLVDKALTLMVSIRRKKGIFQGGHRLKVKIIEAKRLKVDAEE